MADPVWQTVALAGVNTVQVVLLAFITGRGIRLKKELNGHLKEHQKDG